MEDFIKDCKYKSEILEAKRYEEKLAYFIQTHLNSDIHIASDRSIDELWASSNPFINWVKGWMRRENFDSYIKFLRHPLPTASLIQDDIVPELKKVFDATNSYYDYTFSSQANKNSANQFLTRYSAYYKDVVFPELINNHNSIIITDYKERKNPYRYIIDISSVLAIEPDREGKIKRIAFEGLNEEGETRYYYYTKEFYAVYIKTEGVEENTNIYRLEATNPHDINECPADFVSQHPLNSNKFVVRKSIFSNFLEKFENYVNYYTLQKMCLPHGAIPIITHFKQNNKDCGTIFENGTKCVKGYLAGKNGVLGNKDSLVPCPVCNPKTIIQAGSVFGIPIPKYGDNGEKPFDLNANFVKFHYIPVDILKWWNEFVLEKYSDIKYQLVGKGIEEANGQAKNKEQIARGNQTLENTLIELSGVLSSLQTSLDSKILRIIYRKAFKSAFVDKGTDFYLETEFELREALKESIDPIDKLNLISRINYAIHKDNPQDLQRNSYLYMLLPYSTIVDVDFLTIENVDPKLRELRLNFKYYIDLFESEYGDLTLFFNEYFGEKVNMNKKLEMARKLLLDKVKVTKIQKDETP